MSRAADERFLVRAALPQDAEALVELLDELGYPSPVAVVQQRLGAMLASGEAVFVATRGEEVLGFVTVHATPVLHRPTPVGRLTALVVASRARGQGLGRALVASAERHLAAAGCALVEVTSNRDLTQAHAFYQRLGYAITSYRFAKPLPPGPAGPAG